MTHLHRHRGFVQTAGLLIAIGCSSRVEVAQPGTGGFTGTGGKASGGVSSVGGVSATGGIPLPDTGGTANTGSEYPIFGGSFATGGKSSIFGATGGMPYPSSGGSIVFVQTGGWIPTGGAPWEATGGAAWQATGGEATGGAYVVGVTGGNTAVTGVCTPGADHTCNDDPTVSVLMGHCNSDGSCACGDGYVFKHSSGKCLPYEQTVCFSPTQNVDLAYVDRAFGCHCDPNTAVPFCGIDSQGLRVYLDCQAFDQSWHSASTAYCNGSTPLPCFSPTRNPATALTPNALGCSCFQTGLEECVTLATDLDAGASNVLDLDAGSAMSVAMLCNASGRWEGLYAACQ